MPTQPNDQFLEGLYQRMRGRAVDMAPQIDASKDSVNLKPEDISMLWNRRHIPLDAEWELWRQGRTPETAHLPQLTREEIGLMVFKDRERLAKMGGRVEPKEFIRWANAQAEKESAARETAQPPPDGLDMMDETTTTPTAMSGSFDEGSV